MSKIIIAGRGSGCDFVLPDPYASKQHLQIIISENDEVFIVDLDSTSGTTVNGHLIQTNVPVKLNDYDIVRAGDTLIPWKKFLQNEPVKQSRIDENYDEYQSTIRKKMKASGDFKFEPEKKSLWQKYFKIFFR